MLDELFLWINNSLKTLPFSDQIITPAMVDSEHKAALSERPKLISSLHQARFSHAEPLVVNARAVLIVQNEDRIKFIKFFAEKFGEDESASLFLMGMDYFLSLDIDDETQDFYEEKINHIFLILLKENKEKTLDFYRKNQHKFLRFPKVGLTVDAEKTIGYLIRLNTQLSGQENPLSITPFFTQCIDDTEKFASVILWLLEKGVSVERIMQTNLLQKFMLYNVVWLDSPDSPVKHLYRLLGQFPIAASLVEASGKIECGERGFHSYAINGVLCEPSTLRQVAVDVLPFDFTATEENFNALQNLFGDDFLAQALVWNTQRESSTWQMALQKFLNSDAALDVSLPALINRVGAGGPSPLLRAVADLIEDTTVDKLIASHNGAILHLLTYNSNLSTKITATDINNYLLAIDLTDANIWTNIQQLLAVLSAFKGTNPVIASLVYEKILDIAIQHQEMLEDNYVIKQLKKFPGAETIINRRCAQLQAEFDRCVTTGISAQALSAEGYFLIEDTWLAISRALDVLNDIIPINSHCPGDKYKLQGYLAKLSFSLPFNPFKLDDFVRALGVTSDLTASAVTSYERLLIELVTTVDDSALRDEIIAIFESNTAKKDTWMHEKYGEDTVFIKAVQQGNVGVLAWLQAKIICSQEDIHHAVTIAAECHQWGVVNYFCSLSAHKPQQHVLKELLNLAAKTGQLETVQILCGSAISHLQEKIVEQALLRAAVNNQKAVVQYLCMLPTKAPSVTVVAKALKMAIQFNCNDCIDFMGNLLESELLKNVVARALIYAVTEDNLLMVERLCRLRGNKPAQPVIEEAFIKAIKCGKLPIAQFLERLPGFILSQKTIDDALGEAIANEYLPGIKYLCELRPLMPSQAAIERALQQAVRFKRLDIADYFYTLATKPVRLRALEQATELATKNGDLPMVTYLSKLVSIKEMEQVLQLAARQGHLDIVRYCCELNPPSRQALFDARKKALASEHTSIVSYVNTLLFTPGLADASSHGFSGESPTPAPLSPLMGAMSPAAPLALSTPVHEESEVMLHLLFPPTQTVAVSRAESLGYVGLPPLVSPRPCRPVTKSASCAALSALGSLGFFSGGAPLARSASEGVERETAGTVARNA